MSEFKKAESRIITLKVINENLKKKKNEFSNKNDTLKKEINVLSEKCITLKKGKKAYIDDNRTLCNENINLKKEIEKLKLIIDKLILNSTKLELLLKDNKDSNNKTEIGYNFKITNRISTIKFVSSKTSSSTSRTKRYKSNFANYKHVKTIILTFAPHIFTSQDSRNVFDQMSTTFDYTCKRTVHKVFQSNTLMTNSPFTKGIRKAWIKKGAKITNPKGPKVVWRPKSIF